MENIEQQISALSPEQKSILQKRLKKRGISSTKDFKLSRVVTSEEGRYRDWPMSFAQQRLWLFQQLNPDSSAYNVFSSLHLEGELNVRESLY